MIYSQENIKVGILNHTSITCLKLHSHKSIAFYNAEGKQFTKISRNDNLIVSLENEKLRIVKNNSSLGLFDTIFCKDSSLINISLNKTEQQHPYYASFKIFPSGKDIRIINILPLEKYIVGVVAAESGYRATDEYYKVQAIIARTYALFNKNKHHKEKFDICNGTHCQVYHGVIKNKKIEKNVLATRNMVVVDSAEQLIAATYHSNSGGQTMNAIDVWGVDYPYLKSVKDDFSLNYKYVDWEKTIDSADWISYFIKYGSLDPSDSQLVNRLMNFRQTERLALIDSTLIIPLTQIRKDFKLKSTFFSIKKDGRKAILQGKGFGHGVGLSQIGAMEMAKIGFTCEEIIHFYYHHVLIKDYHKIKIENQ